MSPFFDLLPLVPHLPTTSPRVLPPRRKVHILDIEHQAGGDTNGTTAAAVQIF
jgi:hypothetical protein